MAGFTIPYPRFRAFTTNGVPLAGGKLYSFAAGTSAPLAVYQDQALTTPHANPVVLDANGEATIYVDEGVLYKFRLDSSADVTQPGWPVDNVSVPKPAAPPAAITIPPGVIWPYGGTAAPSGYLMCDGSAVSRTTFAALFAIVGTAFGAGDGSTTFNLPDLRGRFPLGKATAGTGNVLGVTGGTIDHTHTGPSHAHNVTVGVDGWGSVLTTPGVTGRLQTGNAGGSGADASQYMATTALTLTTVAAGTGATGIANPPFQVVNFIVKT